MAYKCESCGVQADLEDEVKHKPDCKKSLTPLLKICSRSGTAPHASEEKK